MEITKREERVPCFSGKQEDFDKWSRRFTSAIGMRDPELVKIIRQQNEPNFANDQADAKKQYETNKEILYYCIMSAMDDKHQRQLENKAIGDGYKAWSELTRVYKRVTFTDLQTMQLELFETTLDKIGDINKYIDKVEDLTRRIHKAEGNQNDPTDRKLTNTLFSGLPNYFRDYINMKNQEQNINYEEVVDHVRAIQQDEDARRKKEQMKVTQTALWTNKGDNRLRRPSNNTKDKMEITNSKTPHQKTSVKCKNCQKIGHNTEKCWYLNSYKCLICKNNSHTTRGCWNNPKNKHGDEKAHSTTLNNNYEAPTDFVEDRYAETTQELAMHLNDHTKDDKDHLWIVDSGATSHMCHDISLFTTLERNKNSGTVIVANNQRMNIQGEGTVQITTREKNGQKIKLNLQNTLYIPELGKNLISTTQLMRFGHTAIFNGKTGSCTININSTKDRYIETKKAGKLFLLVNEGMQQPKTTFKPMEFSLQTTNHEASLDVWHSRLGHTNETNIIKLSTAVTGLKITNKGVDTNTLPCEICSSTKMKKLPSIVSS